MPVASAASTCTRILQLTLAKPSDLRLSWLDDLPHAESLCAHVCLKGMRCSSTHTQDAIRGLKRMRVHSCVEEPGGHENGHEGVCAYRFLLDNYDSPTWQGVFFLHGDVVTPHHAGQFKAFKEYLQHNEWPKWPSTRAEMKPEHCGCGNYGSLLNPFGPKDFWHLVMTWWLGQFLVPREPHAAAAYERWVATANCRHAGRSEAVCNRYGVGAWPLHNGTLSSPLGFMFAVDRASALQRSRRFLEAQYRMCKVGVRVLPPGMHGAARAARLPAPAFDYNPLVYGHVNERIPFFVFGKEFVERPHIPPCLFEGDHADMNCTQPELRRPANGTQHLRHQHGGADAAPSVPWGCKPFDPQCGTAG